MVAAAPRAGAAPGGAPAARIIPLEGVRGVSVLLVLFVHYHSCFGDRLPEGSIPHAISHSAHAIGNTGVDLFFILSGLLVYGGLIRRATGYGRFLVRRGRRLYPVYLAMLAVYIALSFVFPQESKIPAGAREGALYLVANALFLPGLLAIPPMIAVAWSLSYEAAFYVSVPPVAAALRRLGGGPRRRLLALVPLAASFAVACALWFPEHARLLFFFVGMILFELLEDGAMRSWTALGLPATLVALAAALTLVGLLGGHRDLLPAALTAGVRSAVVYVAALSVAFGLFIGEAIAGRRALARFLSSGPLRTLGNMSYSYYLVHGLVVKASSHIVEARAPGLLRSPLGVLGLLPLVFAATVVAAYVRFVLIEERFSLGPPAPASAPRAAEIPVEMKPARPTAVEALDDADVRR